MADTDVQDPPEREAESTQDAPAAENGRRPIDKIRQATRDKRRSIEVEDWDLTLYFAPLTTADVEAIDAAMEDDGIDPQKNQHDRRIRQLIEKAELEDGTKAFRPGDAHYLKTEADYMTLQRVIGAMYKSTLPMSEEGIDEAKKDSGMTPTSGSD